MVLKEKKGCISSENLFLLLLQILTQITQQDCLESGVLLDGIPKACMITAGKGSKFGILGPTLGHFITVTGQRWIHQFDRVNLFVLPIFLQEKEQVLIDVAACPSAHEVAFRSILFDFLHEGW